jgi:hypothetical protein
MGTRIVVGSLWTALVATLATGCANTGSSWKPSGYRQDVFGYEVGFRDTKARMLAGPDWQLDNHRYDNAGGAWEEKTGDDYMATRALDWDQDGTVSPSEQTKEPIFDIKLVNKRNNGVIWTKAHPFLPEDADNELDVLLTNYVEGLSGYGRYAQGNLFGIEKARTKNFMTFLVTKELTKIGPHDAIAGTVEIAEVDRLKHDPSARSGIVKIVMVKVRCLTVANCRVDQSNLLMDPQGNPMPMPDLKRWPQVDCRGKPCRARMGLLVVGYYNNPSYFAAGLPEMDDLLKRISFPDAQPLPVPPSPAIAKPTPPASTPPAPADGNPVSTGAGASTTPSDAAPPAPASP